MATETGRPKPTLIMHSTHIDNLPAILAAGQLLPANAAGARLAMNVGTADIKASRRDDSTTTSLA